MLVNLFKLAVSPLQEAGDATMEAHPDMVASTELDDAPLRKFFQVEMRIDLKKRSRPTAPRAQSPRLTCVHCEQSVCTMSSHAGARASDARACR